MKMSDIPSFCNLVDTPSDIAPEITITPYPFLIASCKANPSLIFIFRTCSPFANTYNDPSVRTPSTSNTNNLIFWNFLSNDMAILWIADCGLRILDCGLRIADCGLRIADCVRRSQAKADCGFEVRLRSMAERRLRQFAR